MPNIHSRGGVEISGAQGISVEFGKTLNRLVRDPNTSWVKDLQNNPNVNWSHVKDEHKRWNKKCQGLTPAAMAVIGVAVACMTAGTGLAGSIALGVSEAVGGGILGGTLGAMSVAGATTLTSQSIISVANNQGHMGKILKDMTSKEQLESLGISMAVAGLSYGIGSQLGISQTDMDFSSRLGRTAVQTGVSTGVSASKGADPRQLFLQAGANIAASAVACAVADKIGTWYTGGEIDSVLQKVLHAGSGFLQGMASNLDDPVGGGVGGAFASLAEVVFEVLPDSLDKDVRANIAITSAVTAAFFTKQDVNAAALTATNAVYHNSMGGGDEQEKGEASKSHPLEDIYDGKPVIDDPKALLAGLKAFHGVMTPEIRILSETNQAAHGIVHKTFQEIEKSPNLTQGLKCAWDGAMLGMFPSLYQLNRALPKSYQFLPTPRGTAYALVDMALPTNGYGIGLTASMFVTGGTTRAASSVVRQGLRSGAGRIWATVQEMRVAQSKNVVASMDLFQAQALLTTPKGIPNAGGHIRSFVTTQEEVYYRVYSGNTTSGRFLTKVPPKNNTLAQQGLSLPPSNTAEFIQEVIVPTGVRLQRSRAVPILEWEKRGGMEQFQILEKDITKIIFKDGKPF